MINAEQAARLAVQREFGAKFGAAMGAAMRERPNSIHARALSPGKLHRHKAGRFPTRVKTPASMKDTRALVARLNGK